jgi:hypothetical protein
MAGSSRVSSLVSVTQAMKTRKDEKHKHRTMAVGLHPPEQAFAVTRNSVMRYEYSEHRDKTQRIKVRLSSYQVRCADTQSANLPAALRRSSCERHRRDPAVLDSLLMRSLRGRFRAGPRDVPCQEMSYILDIGLGPEAGPVRRGWPPGGAMCRTRRCAI